METFKPVHTQEGGELLGALNIIRSWQCRPSLLFVCIDVLCAVRFTEVLHSSLSGDKMGLQSLPNWGRFLTVKDYNRQWKGTIFVINTGIQLLYAALRLTLHHVLSRHHASNTAKEPEKLCYKTLQMPLVYRACSISRHVLKMCKLPSCLYSFQSKELITVKRWGARGKRCLAEAGRNLLWTLMRNISTLFITKSTGRRWWP